MYKVSQNKVHKLPTKSWYQLELQIYFIIRDSKMSYVRKKVYIYFYLENKEKIRKNVVIVMV